MRTLKILSLTALLLALLAAAATRSFGQQGVQIIRQDGTVETFSVRTFDTTPQVIPIKPYGLNLQPAKIPQKVRPPVTFNPSPYSPGPVTIENPYFKEPEPTLADLLFRSIGTWVSKLTQ